jgi:hypothetical protein
MLNHNLSGFLNGHKAGPFYTYKRAINIFSCCVKVSDSSKKLISLDFEWLKQNFRHSILKPNDLSGFGMTIAI